MMFNLIAYDWYVVNNQRQAQYRFKNGDGDLVFMTRNGMWLHISTNKIWDLKNIPPKISNKNLSLFPQSPVKPIIKQTSKVFMNLTA